MPDKNFLIGYGERLTRRIPAIKGGGAKSHPRTFAAAKQLLIPQVQQTALELKALPDLAKPNDEAVALVTLHPAYLAKSYFPTRLLEHLGLKALGTRPRQIVPHGSKKKEMQPTTQLYVAGNERSFHYWGRRLPTWEADMPGVDQLIEIERVAPVSIEDRLKPITSKRAEPYLEIVLHASPNPRHDYILEGFEAYVHSLNLKVDLDLRIYAGKLCFLPLRAPKGRLRELANFSFLRAVRELPTLRPVRPILRKSVDIKPVELPAVDAAEPNLRMAVFDGGLPAKHLLSRWAQNIESPDLGKAVGDYEDHGYAVTSALLFGPIEPGRPLPTPYANVDHYRVLDQNSNNDPAELFDVLRRIQSALQSRRYQFACLCVGPNLPIEDDDVHAWTAVLDEILSDGSMLLAIAAGNSGHLDRAAGNARIQPPADSVNGLTVGSGRPDSSGWTRAGYSSLGPGRSPGIVKPDILSFGGDTGNPFVVLHPRGPGFDGVSGTSFAAPGALRLAAGIHTHFGPILRPLTTKALLIHASQPCSGDDVGTGWGIIPNHLDDFVVCPDGVVRIVYQGKLTSSQFIRAQIPLPEVALPGFVSIRATFCFATAVDPQDPGNYTRSGLNIRFRPHHEAISGEQGLAKTAPFFQLKTISDEAELRKDAHHWETALHREKRFQGSSLKDPVFDIHFNARENSAAASETSVIQYALVLSVRSQQKDLYNQVVRRFAGKLEILRPVIEIPVRT